MTTPATLAAAIIIQALQDAKDNAVTPETINAMDRALTVARESGVLIGPDSTPVVDLLDGLYRAMPAPGTNKLSAVWNAAAPTVHRPRYRVTNPDVPQGPMILTDTATGQRRIWAEGEPADNMRAAFKHTDSGAFPSELGVGVCGMHEELAAELIERIA